jgi:dehydrogenase/reductase SDR family member 7B
VFISGGSSGIGEELCTQMLKCNAKKVIIAARGLEQLKRVQSSNPSRIEII